MTDLDDIDPNPLPIEPRMCPTVGPRPPWMDLAECEGLPREWWFSPETSTATEYARAICARCPVRGACGAFADEHHLLGLWGGRSEWDRIRAAREHRLAGAPPRRRRPSSG
jgi:hypothetical protein